MSLRLIPFGLVALFVLSGCGRFDRLDDGKFTEVRFNQSQESTAPGALATFTGGVLVYAYSTSFATNLKLNDETGSGVLSLPNGAYTFFAIGYDDSASPLTKNTTMKCAVTGPGNSIILDGTPKNIALNLTAADCTSLEFADSSNYFESSASSFNRIGSIHCAASVNISTLSAANDCISTGWGGIGGYRTVVPAYSVRNGVFNRMGEMAVGNCNNAIPSGGYTNSLIRFPAGRSDRPFNFPVEFYTYTEGSCTSTPIATHRFHKGLTYGAFPDGLNLGKMLLHTSGGQYRVYFRTP